MLSAPQSIQSTQEAWFDEFIAAVRTHQLQLETETAPQELKQVYQTLMSGNEDTMASLSKALANKHFIKKLVLEYLLAIRAQMPIKLAFDMDDSEVLIWAEVENGNEDKENFLLMAEAQVNAKYHKFGYDLTSTIVENSDHLPIPNHYAVFKA